MLLRVFCCFQKRGVNDRFREYGGVGVRLSEENKCTGCMACVNICPKAAVSITLTELNKTVPMIDETKCVSCGLCTKSCPVINKPHLEHPRTAYAAWSENEQDLKLSSSGGIAALLMRSIIKKSGVVFGAASIDGTVKHIGIHELSEINTLRGSKYVQSETGYCYREVRELLKQEKQVLYIGTPCQIAGLYGFLKSRPEGLITVDLICHGTPPVAYMQEHANSHVKTEWDEVSFRGKNEWNFTVYKSDTVLYQRDFNDDLYFRAFLDALIYRDNCYHCEYARPERVSDITIGDFWGLNRKTLTHPYDGRVSLVLPNTEKGYAIFEEIKPYLVWEEREIKEAYNEQQGNLLHPSAPHRERDIFLSNYRKYGFDKAVLETVIGKEVQKHYRKRRFDRNIVVRGMRKAFRIIKKIQKKCC